MKKYMLFGGDQYYPLGGMSDFIDSYDDTEKLLEHVRSEQFDWWHVLDRRTMEFVNLPGSEEMHWASAENGQG